MAQIDTSDYVTLRIHNKFSHEVSFSLEPYGEEYALPGNEVFEVTACGYGKHPIEIEFEEDRITLWAHHVQSLFHKDEELGKGLWERPPSPVMP